VTRPPMPIPDLSRGEISGLAGSSFSQKQARTKYRNRSGSCDPERGRETVPISDLTCYGWRQGATKHLSYQCG